VAARGATGVTCSMAYCSSCAPALRGLICQSDINPYQTCHRRFQQWVRSGIMRGILEAVAEGLRLRGGFRLEEAFIDGSFAPAKKGE
jgi:hypothetical protein